MIGCVLLTKGCAHARRGRAPVARNPDRAPVTLADAVCTICPRAAAREKANARKAAAKAKKAEARAKVAAKKVVAWVKVMEAMEAKAKAAEEKAARLDDSAAGATKL